MWICRESFSFYFIAKERKDILQLQNGAQRPRINILLPVLNEKKRLREFIAYYNTVLTGSYSNIQLFIITTERERKDNPGLETWEIASQAGQEYVSITRVHYPYDDGKMAHQLNYAIDRITEGEYFAVYNADSRPEPETFGWVARQHITNDKNKACIYQQYGIYTKNVNEIKKIRFHNILVANAYWQNRWALGFEYYRAKSTILKQRWPHILRPFNYCIGHGLFINSSAMKVLRFREDTMNEDAIFGLEASVKNIDIIPIPYFDIADSPDMVSSIYLQKSSWFYGPLQAPLYSRYLSNIMPEKRFSIMISSVKLFTHAIYWLIGPLFALMICVMSVGLYFSTNNLEYLAIALSPAIFLVVPALLGNYYYRKLTINYPYALQETRGGQLKSLLIGSYIAYLIHGAAALRGLLRYRSMVKSRKIKTVMRET